MDLAATMGPSGTIVFPTSSHQLLGEDGGRFTKKKATLHPGSIFPRSLKRVVDTDVSELEVYLFGRSRAQAASPHVTLPPASHSSSTGIGGGVVFCAGRIISLTMMVLLFYYCCFFFFF